MNAPTDPRVPALDGVRGLAILLVMQYHFWGLTFGTTGYPLETKVDRWANDIQHFGWTGVDLFFVLSGFLITGILLDAKAHASRYFRNFYARRFLRIFPLYYAFLAFLLFVVPLVAWRENVARIDELRESQFYFWFYLVNIGAAIKPLDAEIPLVHSHFWTLALEEQFYIVWPFVVLVLSRRKLLWLCLSMPVLALAFRIIVVAEVFPSFFHLNAALVLPPARMDILAMGAIAALAVRGEVDLTALRRAAPYIASAAGVALAVLFVWRGSLYIFDDWTLTVGLIAIEMLWFALLIATITAAPGTVLARFFCHPFMRAFGKYSYCLYVIHLFVSFELSAWLFRHDLLRTAGGMQLPFNVLFSVAATAICFGIAYLSWNLFEKQFLKLKVYFRDRPVTPAPDDDPTRVTPVPAS